MQRIFASLLASGVLMCDCVGQGLVEFRSTATGAMQLPPNSSESIGITTFTLRGSYLVGELWLPQGRSFFKPVSAMIEGPSSGSIHGDVIALGSGPFFMPGSEGVGGGYNFSLGSTLTQPQLDQLWSSQLFVNITSESHPGGYIRGAILQVPEPTATTLFIIALLSFSARKRAIRSTTANGPSGLVLGVENSSSVRSVISGVKHGQLAIRSGR